MVGEKIHYNFTVLVIHVHAMKVGIGEFVFKVEPEMTPGFITQPRSDCEAKIAKSRLKGIGSPIGKTFG